MLSLEQLLDRVKSHELHPPHPVAYSWHGFTCAVCGGHSYTTRVVRQNPTGLAVTKFGLCNSCDFTWIQDPLRAGVKVLHHLPKSEWHLMGEENRLPVFRSMMAGMSLKALLLETRSAHEDLGTLEEYDRVRRHPDTVTSLPMSVAAVDKAWADRWSGDPERRSILAASGVTFFSRGSGDRSADSHVLMSDDTLFGHPLLKKNGWVSCSFSWCGTALQEFSSWGEHLKHYYEGATLIEDVDSLWPLLDW